MNQLKKLDIFGYPVSLAYKKRDKYKSCTGSICTIIFILIIGFLLAMKITQAKNHENVYTLEQEYRSDVGMHPVPYKVNKDNFLIAVTFSVQKQQVIGRNGEITYVDMLEEGDNLDRYFRVDIAYKENIRYAEDVMIEPIKCKKCTHNMFKIS